MFEIERANHHAVFPQDCGAACERHAPPSAPAQHIQEQQKRCDAPKAGRHIKLPPTSAVFSDFK